MIERQIDSLQDLVMCELVEFQAPLTFILFFATLAYGPNIQLFGNIGNSYWTYSAIDDISKAIQNVIFFFLVDFSSTIISSLVLWLSCNINLWKACSHILNEFEKSFCIILGFYVFQVGTIIDKKR